MCRYAIISRVHPLRSHTLAAQGGINAVLGNASEHNWEKHMYDTIKRSDFFADQDTVEVMAKEGSERIITGDLEVFESKAMVLATGGLAKW